MARKNISSKPGASRSMPLTEGLHRIRSTGSTTLRLLTARVRSVGAILRIEVNI